MARKTTLDTGNANDYYDEAEVDRYTGQNERLQQDIVDYATAIQELMSGSSTPIGQADLCLDIGCGSGLSVRPHVTRDGCNGGCFWFGLDLSLAMLTKFKTLLGNCWCEMILCDVGERLPLRKNVVTRVQSISAIQWLGRSQLSLLMEEIERVTDLQEGSVVLQYYPRDKSSTVDSARTGMQTAIALGPSVDWTESFFCHPHGKKGLQKILAFWHSRLPLRRGKVKCCALSHKWNMPCVLSVLIARGIPMVGWSREFLKVEILLHWDFLVHAWRQRSWTSRQRSLDAIQWSVEQDAIGMVGDDLGLSADLNHTQSRAFLINVLHFEQVIKLLHQ